MKQLNHKPKKLLQLAGIKSGAWATNKALRQLATWVSNNMCQLVADCPNCGAHGKEADYRGCPDC